MSRPPNPRLAGHMTDPNVELPLEYFTDDELAELVEQWKHNLGLDNDD